MLTVHCNSSFKKEREYINDILLKGIWGLEYEIVYEMRQDTCIEENGKKLIVDDSFFQQPEDVYLSEKSLPKQPLKSWQVFDEEILWLFVEKKLPVIFGQPLPGGEYLSVGVNEVHIGIDIFGSAFFMLTRYEEAVKCERDEFGRFPAKESLALQEGFLERPIINEYLELLWWGIKKLWSEMERKKRTFKIIPTHDVDRPSGFLGFIQNNHWRRFAGDIILRKSLSALLRRGRIALDTYREGFRGEWKYTYDYIMDLSESLGLCSTFFFMTPTGLCAEDGIYKINHAEIMELVQHIYSRGHKIGVHPSYVSFRAPEIIRDNVNRLREVLNKLSIDANFGGRQHYLRWEAVTTWQGYEDAGLLYDTTLSFAEHIGFRCGICYEYPCFNLKTRQRLKLMEYPLIIMDGTAYDYMRLSEWGVIERAVSLKNICKKFNGNFVILWHNDMFIENVHRRMYSEILKG